MAKLKNEKQKAAKSRELYALLSRVLTPGFVFQENNKNITGKELAALLSGPQAYLMIG